MVSPGAEADILDNDPGGRQLNRNPVATDLYNLFLDNLRETKLKYQGNTKLVNADFTTRDMSKMKLIDYLRVELSL